MEDKVKQTTGKSSVKRKRATRSDAVSEVPEQKEEQKAQDTRISEKRQPTAKDVKGKVSTIKVDTKGEEVRRVIGYDELIKDFWNYKPTVKTSEGVNLHLVDYRGNLRWFSKRQVEITARRVDEIIVDNQVPSKINYLALPKFTEITIERSSKCKGCG